MKKPIICLDFDGVLHSYTSGWKGINVISDLPTRGAIKFLQDLINCGCFKVAIFSSRSATELGIDAIKSWLRRHGFYDIDEVDFPATKPPAHLTIDDRAMTFKGVWPSIEELQNFEPYREK